MRAGFSRIKYIEPPSSTGSLLGTSGSRRWEELSLGGSETVKFATSTLTNTLSQTWALGSLLRDPVISKSEIKGL